MMSTARIAKAINQSPNKSNPRRKKRKLQSIIKKSPTVKPTRMYPNEEGINPAYLSIEKSCPIPLDEKRIWVLRSDFELVTGIKNTYVKYGNVDIRTKLNKYEKNHPLYEINMKDRYGHPSLAIAEGDYDGSVYYAGWVAQRSDHLQFLLWTGRYQNDELNSIQTQSIELYMAHKFTQSYGEQPVIFYDWEPDDDDTDMETFLQNKAFAADRERRVYTPDLMREVSLADRKCRVTENKVLALIANHKGVVDEFKPEPFSGDVSSLTLR